VLFATLIPVAVIILGALFTILWRIARITVTLKDAVNDIKSHRETKTIHIGANHWRWYKTERSPTK
jgi:hypothetical protein